MPNHVTNELTAAKHVLDSLKSTESELDFNTVVPMPEIMKGEPDSAVIEWAQIGTGIINLKTLQEATSDPVAAFQRNDYGAATKRLKQANAIRAMTEGPFPIDWESARFESLLQCMRALKDYGQASWYEWSIANWGTKWNAYDIERRSDTTIKFETAWSMPDKWLEKLIEKFPNEPISIRWADEDFGYNVGSLSVASDGTVTTTLPEGGSVAAQTLAVEILYGGVAPEDMRVNSNGGYSYVED